MNHSPTVITINIDDASSGSGGVTDTNSDHHHPHQFYIWCCTILNHVAIGLQHCFRCVFHCWLVERRKASNPLDCFCPYSSVRYRNASRPPRYPEPYQLPQRLWHRLAKPFYATPIILSRDQLNFCYANGVDRRQKRKMLGSMRIGSENGDGNQESSSASITHPHSNRKLVKCNKKPPSLSYQTMAKYRAKSRAKMRRLARERRYRFPSLYRPLSLTTTVVLIIVILLTLSTIIGLTIWLIQSSYGRHSYANVQFGIRANFTNNDSGVDDSNGSSTPPSSSLWHYDQLTLIEKNENSHRLNVNLMARCVISVDTIYRTILNRYYEVYFVFNGTLIGYYSIDSSNEHFIPVSNRWFNVTTGPLSSFPYFTIQLLPLMRSNINGQYSCEFMIYGKSHSVRSPFVWIL